MIITRNKNNIIIIIKHVNMKISLNNKIISVKSKRKQFMKMFVKIKQILIETKLENEGKNILFF